MAQLISLAASLGAFTAAAVLLALIAAVVLIAAEELFRGVLNASILSRWLQRYDVPLGIMADLRRWTSLPYRQMAGIIASILQANALSHAVVAGTKDVPRDSLRDIFVRIGSSVLDFDIDKLIAARRYEYDLKRAQGLDSPESFEVDEIEGVRSMLAERALDDLQATLGVQWTRLRYVTATVAIAVTFGIVQIQLGSAERLGFFNGILAFPAILVVAVFFAPLLRDMLEQVTARRR